MLETLLHGRYRIIQVLGSGGFGQTYVAQDIQQADSPKCVVKQFKPARQDADFLEIARRLFFAEANALRKLGCHNQVPALVADFEENQQFYLVQEYVEGQSLHDELSTVKRLTEADATVLLRDVLNVLEFVHQNQVIHRDIKPGNLIRRQQDGRFVLIDFGAVKEIQTQITTAPGQTNLTIGIGTQGYVPSEQLMGKPRYNSDLYALGMTIIQALTGLQPFQLPTHPDTAEVVWQDEAPEVSPKLAVILNRMTRYHFSQRYQSVREVLQALDQPTELVPDQTRLHTLLPPAPETRPIRNTPKVDDPPTVVDSSRQRSRKPVRSFMSVGIASLAITGLLGGIRQLGWLQPLELAVFDRMTQLSPNMGDDPRLLVVGITDADIQTQQRFPLSDRTIAQTLTAIKRHQPKVIGLDLLRDVPQQPGQQELIAALRDPNVIVINNLGATISSTGAPATPPPPGVPPERVGFNDFVLDADGVIRRSLMFADGGDTTTFYSFSLRLVEAYLATQGISLQADERDPNVVRLGKAVLRPLEGDSGGYQTIDARGYQIMLKYRSRTGARQVSLSDVLNQQVNPEWIKNKIVLIGTTALSGKDLFFTPYSANEKENPKMAGVIIHAQMVSQFLNSVLDGRSPFWFWPEWVELAWIGSWALLGGSLAWYVQRPLVLGVSGTALLIVLVATGFGVFMIQGWIPIVAPALAATAAGGVVIAYGAYGRQRLPE